MSRFLRFLLGASLLPLCVAVTLALLDTLRGIPTTESLFSPQTAVLLSGYVLWLIMWFFLPRPVRAYVIAHELTHALWGMLFGARVSNMRISDNGGSVRLSKSNMFITLAPYFFPFYTILVVLLRLLIGCFVPNAHDPLVWLFLVGLTWGFHVTFTVQSLMVQQPDICEYGRLFSYAIIYLFNLTGVGLWVVCTTPATFGVFIAALFSHTVTTYTTVCVALYNGVRHVVNAVTPAVTAWLHRHGG